MIVQDRRGVLEELFDIAELPHIGIRGDDDVALVEHFNGAFLGAVALVESYPHGNILHRLTVVAELAIRFNVLIESYLIAHSVLLTVDDKRLARYGTSGGRVPRDCWGVA